jgi:hypothetical protein
LPAEVSRDALDLGPERGGHRRSLSGLPCAFLCGNLLKPLCHPSVSVSLGKGTVVDGGGGSGGTAGVDVEREPSGEFCNRLRMWNGAEGRRGSMRLLLLCCN